MATAIPATFQPSKSASSPETPIAVKIAIGKTTRKLGLQLKHLAVGVFDEEIRKHLKIPANQALVLERFSDSSASFVALTPENPSSYKQLYRAGKAKLKLRLRATIVTAPEEPQPVPKLQQSEPWTCTDVKPQILEPPTMDTILSSEESAPSESSDKPSSLSHRQYSRLQDLLNNVQGPTAANRGSTGPRSSFPAFVPETAGPFAPAKPSADMPMHLPMRPMLHQSTATCWQVCCNNCDKPMSNSHFHCGICDNGDYDLCEACVSAGALCHGEDHWLIKRFIENGNVVTSTTEKLAPKPRAQDPAKTPMPGAFKFDIKALDSEARKTSEARRTCNCCVRVLPERLLVTCAECPDFDLCMSCHKDIKHGHHPGHTFIPTSSETLMDEYATQLCRPGRHVRHNAICDRCEKSIVGVRHKCLDCPDFDFCGNCFEQGSLQHRHRFVPVYEPIAPAASLKPRHVGIYCDGPLCKDKPHQGYINGLRFKCAVCHDTDFCASCQAHPSLKHNKSHPLIMFKTMIKGVSISTIDSDANGNATALGDRIPHATLRADGLLKRHIQSPSTVTLPRYAPPHPGPPSYSSEQVNAIPNATPRPAVFPNRASAQMFADHIRSKQSASTLNDLNAFFKEDTIADGSRFAAGQIFTQRWTMINSGNQAWPIGCSVRHIGGDNMLNVEPTRPVSVEELSKAQNSNVLGQEVNQNVEMSFEVTLRAPDRLGRHISYWRLKTAEGLPFGHKLWCDIEVVTAETLLLSKGAKDKALQQRALKLVEKLSETAPHYRQPKDASSNLPSPLLPRFDALREYQTLLSELEDKRLELKVESRAKKPEPANQELENSAMVFPKLEKESPSSSTNLEQDIKGKDKSNASAGVSEAGRPSTANTTTETISEQGELDIKDIESVEFDSDEDDGFFTDEEYDILDASDEEVLGSGTA